MLRFLTIVCILCCVSILITVVLFDPRRKIPVSKAFSVVEDFTIYNVFDAGIADLNGDGHIDRWTVNHSGAQWIKFGDGYKTELGLKNDIHISGLYQDPGLPGFESGLVPAPATQPIQIYMREAHFVLEVDGLEQGARFQGYFDIPWQTKYSVFGGATVSSARCNKGSDCHRLSFDIPDKGRVELLPVPDPSDGFPITVTLDEGTDLSKVQLGANRITPQDHKFSYHSRDRHNLALADFPDREGPVFFISRGGARGRLYELHPEAKDELFEWTEEGFQNVISFYDIEKDGCPGRQANWQDVNGDGLLDLYQVCGRTSGSSNVNATAGNRLYIQEIDGSFVEDARSFGLDLPGEGIFRFLPQSGISKPLSLLWITKGEVVFFKQNGKGFEQIWRLEASVSGTEKVILNDLDLDGVWEALVFSSQGNFLISLSDALPELRDLQALGLPQASADGAISDFNGDGLRDVLAVPQGIFLRDGNGFVASDLIDLSWSHEHQEVRVVPFDYEGDGDLDLWILVRSGAEVSRVVRAIYNRSPIFLQQWIESYYGRGRLIPRYWRAVLYENRQERGQILLLRPQDLSKTNRAFGEAFLAEVRMPSEERQLQTRHIFIGMDDPSRFSQTFPDIFLGGPKGTELIAIEPLSHDTENAE